jgi:hypothetical protein
MTETWFIADHAADVIQHLLARNSLHLAGANFISSPNRLRGPEFFNLIKLLRFQTLEFVR